VILMHNFCTVMRTLHKTTTSLGPLNAYLGGQHVVRQT
jgi:hypothetical protein